ncbi:MAG: hypothetical protein KDK55_03975 [Chlamydiia bacterium]|nr:hypothetical protein [Chlamydiia bacterium]
MIKVIYFDLGGVLFENGTKNAIEFLVQTFSINRRSLKKIFYGPLSWDLRAGKIDSQSYWEKMSDQYPSICNVLDIKKIWYSFFRLNPTVWEFTKILCKQYPLGIFSGNIEDRVNYLESKFQFKSLFTYEIYSYIYGLNKLNEKLFRIAVDMCKCDPSEILFIDDGQDCLNIAKQLGAHTFLYQGDLKFGLEQYGIQLSTH